MGNDGRQWNQVVMPWELASRAKMWIAFAKILEEIDANP
jgi:hypothetical protein